MEIVSKGKSIKLEIKDIENNLEEFETTYKNTFGKQTFFKGKGIKVYDLLKSKGIEGENLNIYGEDGYKVLFEKNKNEGIPFFAITEDKRNKGKKILTFIVKDNIDGRFRVVDVSKVEVFLDKINHIQFENVVFDKLPFKNITIGRKEHEGLPIIELLEQYEINGEYIEFLSEDDYHAILEKDKYLKDAYILKEKRKLAGLSLKLGNWIKYIKKIWGDKRGIEFK